ncbi:Dna2/Cas4 domain-containing protein [Streptococcus agalactiae]
MKTYEKAELADLVDHQKRNNEPVLLPIYHTSLKSNGKNIISVKLDKDGQFHKAEFMTDKQMIIFPVTADSVARSGSNPASHPLVDKFAYYSAEMGQSQYDSFHKQLNNWIDYCEEGDVKRFLTIVQLVAQTICLEEIFGCYIEKGCLYYHSVNQKKTIEITEELRQEVLDLAEQMHFYYDNKIIGKAEYFKNCPLCSLVDICKPRLSKKTRNVDNYIRQSLVNEDSL